MADLAVKYAGLEFKNPVVAVAGPLGRTFHALKSSIEAGVAAVSLKSCNAKFPKDLDPKPACHIYPRPAHIFLRKYGMPNSMINWEGVPVDFTAEAEAEMIERIKPIAEEHDTKIIANMHPDFAYLQDKKMLREDLRTLQEADPDFFEFCPCPYHVPFEVTYPEKFMAPGGALSNLTLIYEEFCGIVKEEVDIPVIAKANGPLFYNLADLLKKFGIKNFHVTEGPAFYGTIVDIDKMKPLVPGAAVITYGIHRRPIVNLQVARTRALGDFDIMSSSGIWTANDCLERMMCGAQLVGLHTAIQYHGHKLFGKILKGISEFLDEKGLRIDDVIGVAVPDILSPEAHDEFMRKCDLSTNEIRPVIDLDKCTQCGICGNCIHGGISIKNKTPELNLDLCVRCGVCESLCPADAITLMRA